MTADAPKAPAGVYFSGKWYARVSLGTEIEWRGKHTRRPSVALPHATDAASAEARRNVIAAHAKALVEAGHVEYVANTIARCAEIHPSDVGALAKVAATVTAIVAGKVTRTTAKTIAGVTFADVAEMLTSDEIAAKYPDALKVVSPMYAADRAKKLAKYILPVIGPVPITALKMDHGDEVMRAVPITLSRSTRKQVLQQMKFVAGIAVWPLGLITINPLAAIEAKAGKDARVRGFIYPNEDAAMLACVENPIALRMAFGFQTREGMRREEVATLEWKDVDLRHGVVRLDENKTDEPREWPLDPGVAEALRRWRKMNPEARYVFGGAAPLSLPRLADDLRACLKRAGVERERPELFEGTDRRMRVGTHDLRASFVTIASAQGRNERWISRRTGHKSHSMIATYQRAAEGLGEGEAVKLVPLVDAVPELADLVAPAEVCEVPVPPSATASGGGSGGSRSALNAEAAVTREEVETDSGTYDAPREGGGTGRRTRFRFNESASGHSETPGNNAVAGSEVGASEGTSATRPPDESSILSDLAALVARAVAAGDLGLARALIDAQSRSAPAPSAVVVDLAAARSRKP